MKLKLTRWFLPSLLVVFLTLFFATPVMAIEPPDSFGIQGVYAYENCLETGDQLYLIPYNLDYSETGEPEETATDAFLVRLMSGLTELGATAPYAYYDYGYDRGVAAIYFSAAEAPAWEGAYSMRLQGNPLLSWNGTTPLSTVTSFSLWQSNPIATTQLVLASRILTLANQLELAWGVDMVETSTEGSYLTVYGEEYFINVIPNLTEMAPLAFYGETVAPTWPTATNGTAYRDTLDLGITGTFLDFTDAADLFHVTPRLFAGYMWFLGWGILLIVVVRHQSIASYKPLMMFSIPVLIGGAFLAQSLQVTIVVALLCAVFVIYILLYKQSTA